jgi:hypothetical protein
MRARQPAPARFVGVVLVDGHFLGAPQVLKFHVLKLDAEVLGDGFTAGERGDIFKHRLAAVAKARRMMIPPFAVSFSSSLRTSTRSCNGVTCTVISLTSLKTIL